MLRQPIGPTGNKSKGARVERSAASDYLCSHKRAVGHFHSQIISVQPKRAAEHYRSLVVSV